MGRPSSSRSGLYKAVILSLIQSTAFIHYIHLLPSCLAQTSNLTGDSSTITTPTILGSSPTISSTSTSPMPTLIGTKPFLNIPSDINPSTSPFVVLPPLSPGHEPPLPPTEQERRENSLLNAYFLLLGLLVFLIVLAWWAFRKRRREKMVRSQNRGQRALARDVQYWSGQNRWVYSGWRGMRFAGGRDRMEEGLDERGEAPPPYTAPFATQSSLEGLSISVMPPTSYQPQASFGGGSTTRSGVDTVRIPLRTFARSTNPPEYNAYPDGYPRPTSVTTAELRQGAIR